MLESIRKGQRWLTGLFIALIGGVFVFFIGLGGGPQSGGPSGATAYSVVALDDIELTTRDFLRVRRQQEERFQEALGEDYDAKSAGAFLDQQSLRSLVELALLAHSAHDLGLRVSKQEVQELIKRSAGFRDAEGRFDQQEFRSWAEYNYGNQKLFLDSITLELLQQKMVQVLIQQPRISDGEARRALLYRSEEARFVYIAFDTESLPPGESLAEDVVASYLGDNEAHVRELYEQRRPSFETPARATTRHILVRLAADADESLQAAARETLTIARRRIEDGESFEVVAAEVSEDEITRENGGLLGELARGDVDEALAVASFSQELGALADPVQSSQGLHLLRVDARSEAGTRPFEEVGVELAREAAELEAAAERANRLADELLEAVAAGASLEDAARERELTLERPAPIRRRPDGYVPGLGSAPDLVAQVFTLEPGQAAASVLNIRSKRVLVELIERSTPDDSVFEAQLEQTRSELEEAKRNSFVRTWVDAQQRELSEAGRLYINAELATGA